MAKLREFFNIGEAGQLSFLSKDKPKRKHSRFDHAGDSHPGDLGLGAGIGGHDYDDDDDDAERLPPGRKKQWPTNFQMARIKEPSYDDLNKLDITRDNCKINGCKNLEDDLDTGLCDQHSDNFSLSDYTV